MFNLIFIKKMKRKQNVLTFIGAYVVLVLSIIALCGSFCSCQNKKMPWMSSDESTKVMSCVDSIVNTRIQDLTNPVFLNAEEALVWRELDTQRLQYDSIFNSLPEKTVRDVVKVLLKRENLASKRTIVDEYLNHKDVYPYLSQKETTTATEAQPTRVVETAQISIKDTIIDGKPVTITTKIEKKE